MNRRELINLKARFRYLRRRRAELWEAFTTEPNPRIKEILLKDHAEVSSKFEEVIAQLDAEGISSAELDERPAEPKNLFTRKEIEEIDLDNQMRDAALPDQIEKWIESEKLRRQKEAEEKEKEREQ
jgi:hypothetical protein